MARNRPVSLKIDNHLLCPKQKQNDKYVYVYSTHCKHFIQKSFDYLHVDHTLGKNTDQDA